MNHQGNFTGPGNLSRTTLAILFIVGLMVAAFMVVKPFLSSFIWSGMAVIATWPLMEKLQAKLWGKRSLAVAVMLALMLLLLIVPICLAVLTIIDKADEIVGWIKSFSAIKSPTPPEWLAKLPVIGSWAVEHWQRLAALSPQELTKLAAPHATKSVGWFVGLAGNFGLLLLHFLLTVIISGILYFHGETVAAGIRLFARRLGGGQGEELVILSAKAIRGVAMGIVITAVVQSALGGIGLFVAGIPAATLLTAVMFLLCVTQIGAALVMVPVTIWLYWSGQPVAGSIFLVWTVVVCSMDNFLRPVLIRKGADLPLLLIITGVIGGLISFGLLGLFIGPVILAVVYTLARAWVAEGRTSSPADPAA
jgi:predicted PurR-regulated permease PerM